MTVKKVREDVLFKTGGMTLNEVKEKVEEYREKPEYRDKDIHIDGDNMTVVVRYEDKVIDAAEIAKNYVFLSSMAAEDAKKRGGKKGA